LIIWELQLEKKDLESDKEYFIRALENTIKYYQKERFGHKKFFVQVRMDAYNKETREEYWIKDWQTNRAYMTLRAAKNAIYDCRRSGVFETPHNIYIYRYRLMFIEDNKHHLIVDNRRHKMSVRL
jgi:hypothetical protein